MRYEIDSGNPKSIYRSVSTDVDMAKKRDKNSEQSFIATVSKFSNDRLHVEVPKKHRDKTVKDGDAVRVEKIE